MFDSLNMANQNHPSSSSWNSVNQNERVLNESAFYDSLYDYHLNAISSDVAASALSDPIAPIPPAAAPDPLSHLTDVELAQLELYGLLEQPPPPPPPQDPFLTQPSLAAQDEIKYLDSLLAYEASLNLPLSLPHSASALAPDYARRHAGPASLHPRSKYPLPPLPPPEHERFARERDRHRLNRLPENLHRGMPRDRFDRNDSRHRWGLGIICCLMLLKVSVIGHDNLRPNLLKFCYQLVCL